MESVVGVLLVAKSGKISMSRTNDIMSSASTMHRFSPPVPPCGDHSLTYPVHRIVAPSLIRTSMLPSVAVRPVQIEPPASGLNRLSQLFSTNDARRQGRHLETGCGGSQEAVC